MENEKRTVQVQIRLTPSERDAIAKKAEEDHRTVSNYIRLIVQEAIKD